MLQSITSLFLLLSPLTTAQVAPSSAPPVVVQDTAQNILKHDDSPCSRACATLSSELPGQIFIGNSGHNRIWDAKQAELTPLCRVEPASDKDVSLVLRTVVETGCHFAVKGGGHARSPGFSNADGGLTVDLIKMSDIGLSDDGETVTVGAGAVWGDVYNYLEPKGKMVVGGRVADVGVAGLTLAGGISFYSGRHGLACDNVVSYSLILPNSTIISTLTSTTHPTLFKALRGAGQSNFGIVTSFTFSTLPHANPLWDTNRLYDASHLPTLLPLYETYHTTHLPSDPDCAGFNVLCYFQEYDVWWAADRYVHTSHNSTTTWPAAFAPFESIPTIPDTSSTAILPYSNITYQIESLNPRLARNIYGTFTIRPSATLHATLLDYFRSTIDGVKSSVPGLQANLVTQPLSALTMSIGAGANALGLSPADGPLVIFNVAWRWADAAEDALCMGAWRNFMEKAEAEARRVGKWHRYKYANYAEEGQDVWGGYGEESREWLVELQRSVDPEGVFLGGGLASTGFKLGTKGLGNVKKEEEGRRPEGKSEL